MKKLFIVAMSLMVCIIVSVPAISESAPILLEKNKITIIATDAYFDYSELYNECRLMISYYVINESAYDYDISCREGYINGWQIEGYTHTEVDSGLKKKDELRFNLEDVEMKSSSDIQNLEDMSIKFIICPSNGYYPDQIYTEKIDVDWIKQKVSEHK